jgi:aminopeptidase N
LFLNKRIAQGIAQGISMTYSRSLMTALLAATALTLSACSPKPATEAPASKAETPAPAAQAETRVTTQNFTLDRFTQSNYMDVQLSHIDLDLDVNFYAKILDGIATLDFERVKDGADTLVLDTRGLLIKAVSIETADGWESADWALGEEDPVQGKALSIDIGDTAKRVKIVYSTSPDAEGLQWLSPEQTAGKKEPFLFSQAQAINARTMAPLQDTPAVRLTYTARLRVPDGLLPLMSAEQLGQQEDGAYAFSMPQPIPSYLIAIAVGDIKFKAINDTIGVYSEEYILARAAEEFSETPQMEVENEKLYGPYRWGRYDLIVLPPSFPYGGMENPRLSFLTPTLVAGDKSLTNVVAHELAHSWSGNLVTNSNWRDAWLNEGFTSYVENRVMEELYGNDRAVMEQALGLEDLKRDVAGAARPSLTQLKFDDDLKHPDEAFSQVTYVKGQFFLNFLEDRYGRAAFDPFLKNWFNDYAFKAATTEDFLAYMERYLKPTDPEAVTDAEIKEWVYGQGLPDTIRNPRSDAFDKVAAQSAKFVRGEIDASGLKTDSWSTHEWLHFLNGLPKLSDAQMKDLDSTFKLTGTQNAETAFAWYMQAIKADYVPAMPALETFLMEVGRGKFIYRLYGALKDNGKAKMAERVFAKAKVGYHPIAQRRIGDILDG